MNFSILLDRIFPKPTLEHIRCSGCGDVICRCAAIRLDKYLANVKPEPARCPLCMGTGIYTRVASNGTGGDKCHGCHGKGWVR